MVKRLAKRRSRIRLMKKYRKSTNVRRYIRKKKSNLRYRRKMKNYRNVNRRMVNYSKKSRSRYGKYNLKKSRRYKGKNNRVLKISKLKVSSHTFVNMSQVFGIFNGRSLYNKDSIKYDGKRVDPAVYANLFSTVPDRTFSDVRLDKLYDTGIHEIQILLKSFNLRLFNPDKSKAPGYRISFFKPCLFSYKGFVGLNEMFNLNRKTLLTKCVTWFTSVPVIFMEYHGGNKFNATYRSLYDILANADVDYQNLPAPFKFAYDNQALIQQAIDGITMQRWCEQSGVGSISRTYIYIDNFNNGNYYAAIRKIPLSSILAADGTGHPWPSSLVALNWAIDDMRAVFLQDTARKAMVRRRELNLNVVPEPNALGLFANLYNQITAGGLSLATANLVGYQNAKLQLPQDDIVNVNQTSRDLSIYCLVHGLSDDVQEKFAAVYSLMLNRTLRGQAQLETTLYSFLNDYFTPGDRDPLLYQPLEELIKSGMCKIKKAKNDKVYRYKSKGTTNLAFFACGPGTTVEEQIGYGFDRRLLKERVYDIIQGGDKSLVSNDMMAFLSRNALVNKLVVK